MRAASHRVRLALERRVIVDRGSVHLDRRSHASLELLNDVPALVRQVMFLARREMDVLALRVRQRADRSGQRGICVDLHAREVVP